MKLKNSGKQYVCRIFLKSEEDIQLLKPSTRLYGKILESIGVVFMTPYESSTDCLRWIGIIQHSPEIEKVQPLLINVSNADGTFIAYGFVNRQWNKLPVEIIYMSACYERTPFKQSEMNILWKKRVTIIGCGTGGSKIALELARSGIGHLTLCDPQRLELANVSRHEGDLLDVGKAKTQLVAERISRINPAVGVETFFEDIFERSLDKVKHIFANSDLVVAATDSTSIQLVVNELTYKLGIACVFGGCYEEARGGEVFFTLPGENLPCLACLRGGLKLPEVNNHIDYSTATGPEDYQGQPGLHSAVDFITSVEVQVCLAILLRESKTSRLAGMVDPRRSFILIGGMLGQGFYRFRKPFDIFYQPLKGPRRTCPVCQNYGPVVEDAALQGSV